jgi:isovaleryl-CoA dehydrogenase
MTIRSLTDEQRAFVEAIRDFAKRECGTRERRDALTCGGEEPHNQALYERIAELGWLGVAIPERYGGAGGGAIDMCLACDEFARGRIPMSFFSVSMISAGAVERFGSEELKTEIWPLDDLGPDGPRGSRDPRDRDDGRTRG